MEDIEAIISKPLNGISLEEFIGGSGHFGRNSLALERMFLAFEKNQLLISFRERCAGGENAFTGTQTLRVGLDGAYRKSTLSDGIYFAAGKWVWSDEMELEVRYQEAVGAGIIRLTFDESGLKLSVRSQMPEELDITKRNVTTLTGSLESI